MVYALSGWLKGDSPSYHIRLVTGTKLEGIIAVIFYLVQVYGNIVSDFCALERVD